MQHQTSNNITTFLCKANVANCVKSVNTFMANEGAAQHIIINLLECAEIKLAEVLLFVSLSELHRANRKSFVVVTTEVSLDDVPENFMLVPTLQEALDVIEMEEIERDLGF